LWIARASSKTCPESIRPIEEVLTVINGKYLKAVTKVGERLVLILDLEAVLNVSDVEVPAEADAAHAHSATS